MASMGQQTAQVAASLNELQLPTQLACQVCHRLADCKRCGNCNTVWYCGRDCQRAHWPEHKSLCQHLQDLKRWSAFSQYLGSQFTKTDDEAYSKAPRDLSSLPMLPHLVLGTVGGSLSEQVYLKTWRFSHERPGSIPMFIMREDLRCPETDQNILQASFQQLFGNQALDTVVKRNLPVAIKRSYLHENGFQLPSVIHTARPHCPFGSEKCVFVLQAETSNASPSTAKTAKQK